MSFVEPTCCTNCLAEVLERCCKRVSILQFLWFGRDKLPDDLGDPARPRPQGVP
jgi:hypothetical protein